MDSILGAGAGTLALLAFLCACSGCALDGDEQAARWIEEMDRLPPEERVPDWERTRALMLRVPPAVGEIAPDFALETIDGSATVRLAEILDERPIVLIFGSWT